MLRLVWGRWGTTPEPRAPETGDHLKPDSGGGRRGEVRDRSRRRRRDPLPQGAGDEEAPRPRARGGGRGPAGCVTADATPDEGRLLFLRSGKDLRTGVCKEGRCGAPLRVPSKGLYDVTPLAPNLQGRGLLCHDRDPSSKPKG